MKVKIQGLAGDNIIVIPEELLKKLKWKKGDTLKIELCRDFEHNPNAILISRRDKK
jgi:bifunctional DNA-binding transcriptional regulator/antitoxin component of YhaV-PrlF toxin-antitoxin module